MNELNEWIEQCSVVVDTLKEEYNKQVDTLVSSVIGESTLNAEFKEAVVKSIPVRSRKDE